MFNCYIVTCLKCWTLNILHPDNLNKYKEFKEIQLLIESLCYFSTRMFNTSKTLNYHLPNALHKCLYKSCT